MTTVAKLLIWAQNTLSEFKLSPRAAGSLVSPRNSSLLGGLLYSTLWAAVVVGVAKSSQVAPEPSMTAQDLRQPEVHLSF